MQLKQNSWVSIYDQTSMPFSDLSRCVILLTIAIRFLALSIPRAFNQPWRSLLSTLTPWLLKALKHSVSNWPSLFAPPWSYDGKRVCELPRPCRSQYSEKARVAVSPRVFPSLFDNTIRLSRTFMSSNLTINKLLFLLSEFKGGLPNLITSVDTVRRL